MYFIRKIIFGVFLSLFLFSSVFCQVIYDKTTSIKIEWKPGDTKICDGTPADPATIITWEVWLVRDVTLEVFKYNFQSQLGQSVINVEIPIPKSGVYLIKVRGVMPTCCDGTTPCNGGWADSTNPVYSNLADGTPGSWKIRRKPLGPVGPIIIY